MRKMLEDAMRQLLKIPPRPEPPVGGEGSVQIFRASPGFYRYRLLGWGVRQASALFGIVVLLVVLRVSADWPMQKLFAVLESIGLVLLVVQAAFSFFMISLDYQYRWYMITDRSLRIREGLINVQERTMTFSNIQNVSIRQGPLQRTFGISDLEVRTAGGGSSSSGGNQQQGSHDNLHLGYFRGVANAEEIRDTILRHLRHLRTAGLGDPEEAAAAAAAPKEALVGENDGGAESAGEMLAAGRRILAETRALKKVLAAGRAP